MSSRVSSTRVFGVLLGSQPWRAVNLAMTVGVTLLFASHVLSNLAVIHVFEPFGWWHQNAAIGAQPAPIVETVHGDEAHAGRDQVLEPAVDLGGMEVVAVGMAQRNIDRANVAVRAPGDADAADMAVAPWAG